MNLLKKSAALLHRIVRHSRSLSALYVSGLGAICRSLPDGRWKSFVLNSLSATEWPKVELAPVRVRYAGSDVEARIVPHLNEFDSTALLYRELPYEHEVFRWLSGRHYRTVIEIGANVGVFSLYLARRFPDAMVYSFEPSRAAFTRLLTNIALNRCPNLIPFNCAVYSRAGFLSFHEPEGHLTNGSLDPNFASIFSDRVARAPVAAMNANDLDALIGDAPLLIKMDVEGVEPELLRALQPLIARHRPDLLIEVLPFTEDPLNAIAFLRDGSYRKFRIERTGPVPREKFESGSARDWALLPSSPAELRP